MVMATIAFPMVFAQSLARSWRAWWRPVDTSRPLREAAPDLLAACRDVVRVLDDPRCTFAMPHTMQLVRAAIRKAEGR
jgi:hypothetical protein